MREDFNLLKDDVYSVRTEGNRMRVTKFTKDLHPVQFYCIEETPDGGYRCNCPQSNRGPCKHFDIMDSYALYPERIDKGWFYCHQTGDWFPPIENDRITRVIVEPEEIQDRNPLDLSPEAMAPPSSRGADEEKPPTPSSSAVTPEVVGDLEPPSLPSGVMVFNEPLKRRI